MISPVRGTLSFSGGGPGPIFRSGRLLTVIVRQSGTRGLIIEADGKRFRVSSNIPLQKGDVFVSRVENGPRGIFLKILESPGDYSSTDVHRLSELMRQEPELVRALIRSGLSLNDENIKRYRRFVSEKKGREREEYARYLTLLDEKNMLPLLEPETPDFLKDKEEQDTPESKDTWRDASVDPTGIRGILLRKSSSVTETALFNHKKSGKKDHWMKIPMRLKIGEKVLSGELRLRIGLSERVLLDGILKLVDESANPGESWVFGISDTPERSFYLIDHPPVDKEKLAGFIQKVRKLGFPYVDTLSRGDFDGFSISDTKIPRGVDAQA